MNRFYSIGVLLIFIFSTSCTMTGRNEGQNIRRKSYVDKKAYSKRDYLVENQAKRVKNVIVEHNTNDIIPATEIFKRYNSAVFMVFTTDGCNAYQGSGFFISKDGLAVSNYHVFKGTSVGYEVIKLSDGRQCKIDKVLAYSITEDYILFKVKGIFNYIPVSQRKKEVGERVYTIGSPKGLENTFASGEISQIREDNFIQISCPIDHGSSGGALINKYGEVIGITTGGRDDSSANLNFAKDIQVVPYRENVD